MDETDEGSPVVRLIKGLAALLVLAAGLGGVPAFLIIMIGNPLPATLSWSELVAALTRPDDGSLLVRLVTIVAWIAWVVFLASVIAEVVAVLSHQRIRIRLPGLAVSQRLASGLVVAVVSLAVAAPQLSHADPVRATPQAAPRPAESGVAETPRADRQSAPVRQADQQITNSADSPAGESYTVRAGDDLWSLAERFYGEGREWRTIAAANPTVLTGGPDRLEAGWRLVIPAAESAKQPVAKPTEGHLVQRGETLSSIAEGSLGDSARWPQLFEANRFQLDDPDDLPVGLALVLPEPAAKRTAAADRPAAPATEGKQDSDDPTEAGTTTTGDVPAAGEEGQASTPGSEPDALPRPPADQSAENQPREEAPDEAPPPAAPVPAQPPASQDQPPTSQDRPAGSQDQGAASVVSAASAVVAGLAGVGGLLAAAVIAGTSRRRRAQLQVRPIGRRILQPSPAAQLAEAHLGRRQRPVGLRTLDLATRAIAAHSHHAGTELPELVTATVYEDRLLLAMAAPDLAAPDGFTVDGAVWQLAGTDADRLRATPVLVDAVRPYPALVSVGFTSDGGQVVADLEALRLTSVESDDAAQVDAAVTAIAVELSCSPWAEELELVLVGTCDGLPAALGRHSVAQVDELGPTLARLHRRAARQRGQRAGSSVASHRVDPDLADPWVPTILIVNQRLEESEQQLLRELVLTDPPVSIAAVGIDLDDAASRIVLSAGEATVEPYGLVVTPQLMTPPAVDAVIDLVAVTGRTTTTPAPWWYDAEADPEPDAPDNVTYLGRRFGGWARARPDHDQPDLERDDHHDQEGAAMEQIGSPAGDHPVLLLLGPVDLVGAAGVAPSRAARQCLEYCAWILEHPGTRPLEMGTALAVAEGTRRSNMSRLRSWLGADELDQPYLPDAYSGRILLHPSVSSDWQRLQILTGRGVNRTSSGGLEAALRLVRGAPLADAAPGQWHWAEGLRTDMISVVRDIGVELADRAIEDSDIELARWAASRALVVAPGDEQLLVARVRTEHRAGNHQEVERLTLQLAAHARSLEVDLRPETVDVLQQMMEGRVRARLA